MNPRRSPENISQPLSARSFVNLCQMAFGATGKLFRWKTQLVYFFFFLHMKMGIVTPIAVHGSCLIANTVYTALDCWSWMSFWRQSVSFFPVQLCPGERVIQFWSVIHISVYLGQTGNTFIATGSAEAKSLKLPSESWWHILNLHRCQTPVIRCLRFSMQRTPTYLPLSVFTSALRYLDWSLQIFCVAQYVFYALTPGNGSLNLTKLCNNNKWKPVKGAKTTC